MKEFIDKVAVITGAASGIGRALAERCAQEGMKVVLADVEEDALGLAEKDIKATGVSTLSVTTDVSKASDVEALAQRTLDTFGAVHLLCNNAGVGSGETVWGSTLLDWQWVLGVNLWGVIHGVHFFVPSMLEQNTECHVVNTASFAGIITVAHNGPYGVSKHGVVALSEILYRELAERNSNIGVSVLCPGWINTRILDSARNRPAELQNKPEEDKKTLEDASFPASLQNARQCVTDGMPPSQVADLVFNALKESKFYIFPNAEPFKERIHARMEDIISGRNPTTFASK